MNSPQHAPTLAPLVTVDADHPWLGLASFTEETQRFFFGRDAEIAEIFVRVRDNTLTILYGQSGLGKSSLLGAGLLPKLRVEDYRPVQIRLRYDETDPPLLDQVFAEIEKADLLGSDCPATLWEWLHHRENRPQDFDTRPPVLVFDQFEEIFTLGQRAERLEETRALFTQLAELIENRSPAALRARFQEDRRLARDYDNAPTPARLVITLREDFLSHLEKWKKILPSLMRNRMALDLLDGPQALEAVVRPGRMEGRNLVDDEVGAAIVRFVAKKEADIPLEEIGAVPPLLSLVCDELNRLRIAQNLPTITDGLVETQSSDILNNFYHDSFANLPDAVRHFIEDRLITEGGHRNPVAQEDALTAFRRAGVENPAAALDQLVARRLTSPEERGGLIWIEITHDVLAPLVVRSRDERLERERAAEAERREQEVRKARNKLRFLLSLFSFLTLLAVAGAIFGFLSSREAQRQNAEATAQRDEARYNEGLGWMLRAQVAKERKDQYPDTLLHAAQAIGFEGVGRPSDAPESLLRFIRKDRNSKAYHRARQWIAECPAYLPVWSSAPYPAPVTGLDVSADGRHLALATADGVVRLWDLREGTVYEIQRVGAGGGQLAFMPAGELLATVTGKEVHQHSLSGAKLSGFLCETSVLAYSPDGSLLATAAKDGSLSLWHDGKATVIETGMEKAATAIVFSTDGSRAAALFPGGVRVFFPGYAALAYAWEGHAEESSAVSPSPDGTRLAVGTPDGEVVVYDAASGAVLGRCSGEQRHGGEVRSLAYRPDGKQLASASVDGTVRLWDVRGAIPTVTATLRGHAGFVSRVIYLACGELLASAGEDGGARIWDVSGTPVNKPNLHHYLAAKWYRFDPVTQEARWSGGEGAANVPEGSLLDLHRKKADISDLLAKAKADAPTGTRKSALAKEKKTYKNEEGIELLWVKPGTFQMGSPEGESGRVNYETQHKVTLTQGYWLARTELTQEHWISVMGSSPSRDDSNLKCPVDSVNWLMAIEYCRRLTDLERARGAIPPGWEYSLPTEAQWEYACRAGTETAYSFGNDPADLHKYGNYNDKSGNFANADKAHDDSHEYSAPVGSYPPNEWGFHDMHGNVLEWCRDALNPNNADYGDADVIDPLGKVGMHRVYRGGGFDSTAGNCRSASRSARTLSYRFSLIGFRLALVPPHQTASTEIAPP